MCTATASSKYMIEPMKMFVPPGTAAVSMNRRLLSQTKRLCFNRQNAVSDFELFSLSYDGIRLVREMARQPETRNSGARDPIEPSAPLENRKEASKDSLDSKAQTVPACCSFQTGQMDSTRSLLLSEGALRVENLASLERIQATTITTFTHKPVGHRPFIKPLRPRRPRSEIQASGASRF